MPKKKKSKRAFKLIAFKAYYDTDQDILDWWESIEEGERSDAMRDLIREQLGIRRKSKAPIIDLPELLVAMNDPTQASSPAVRTVALAIRLARHSAETWEDPALPDDYIDIAALLRVSPQRVMEMVIPPTHHHHVHSIPPGTVLPSPA